MTVLHAKSEIETYRATFEKEYLITQRVLRAFPAAKSEFKAAQSSQTAREIAWTLAFTQGEVERILKGDAMTKDMPKIPATWAEVLEAFESGHKRSLARIAQLKDEEMNRTTHTMTGPKQEGDLRVGDTLWGMTSLTIHHRGQLSVYLRMVGGKVPSIYGPSGDEPW